MELQHWESWIDKAIREATEAGEFDDLPGAGKPFADAGRHYEPGWWHKAYVQRLRAEGEVGERIRELDRRLVETARLDEPAMRAEVTAVLSEWAGLAAEHDVPDPPDREEIEASWLAIRRSMRAR